MSTNTTVPQQHNNPILGAVYIVHSMIYIIPYIPCIIAISQQPLIENSCFKIMAAMALPDILQLLISGPYCGIMSILRVPMEDYYLFNKVMAALANTAWHGYASMSVLLAFNRCVELRSSTLATKLFGESKPWVWIAGCYLFAAAIGIIGITTNIATGLYHPDLAVFMWANTTSFLMSTMFNLFVNVSLPILYIWLWVLFRKRLQDIINQELFTDKERRMVLQAFLITLFVWVASFMYLALPMTNMEPHHYWTSHIFWQIMSGCNVVIYLVINLTIRQKVWNMIGCGAPQATARVEPLAQE